MDVQFIPIERPFSNFDFADREFAGLSALRRILSQARQHDAKTLVIEELLESDDLREEREDVTKRCPGATCSGVSRLSFFSKRFSSKRGLASADPEEFVGYAIVKKDKLPDKPGYRTRVYESVIRSSPRDNTFVRGRQEWKCRVGDILFPVEGYIYAQQNDMTNVCAHVALRTVAASFRHDDVSYREMNKILGIDHQRRKVGGTAGGGLDITEMEAVLNAVGASCVCANYRQMEDTDKGVKKKLLTSAGAACFVDSAPDVVDSLAFPPFQKYVYGSVESGFPAIVVFETVKREDCHAIPIFGHTFEEDAWVHRADSSYFRVGPRTNYIPSESWVSMYVGHDDNWGSNFCIPRQYMHTRRKCIPLAKGKALLCPLEVGCVAHVIGTYPKTVKVNAVQAEVVGVDYLFAILNHIKGDNLLKWNIPWGQRLTDYGIGTQRTRLVARPVLIRSQEYPTHLRKLIDWNSRRVNASLVEGRGVLQPEQWLWMIELSVPELFSTNWRKLGEVLVRAESPLHPRRDLSSFVLARIPGYFATYARMSAAGPQFEFWPCGAEDHVQLFGVE